MSPLAGLPLGVPTNYSIPSQFEIFGPITVGVLIGVFGLGILFMQSLVHLDRYPNDSKYIKAMILVSLALNIAQSGTDCSRMIKINVIHAKDLFWFLDMHNRPEELLSPVFTSIICTMAQLFLMRRALIFIELGTSPQYRGSARHRAKKWAVGIVLGSGIALSFAGALGAPLAMLELDSYIQANRQWYPHTKFAHLAVLWLAASAATDILLSVILLWGLTKIDSERETGNRMVKSLIRIAWSSGLIVTALQVATLAAFLTTSSAWSDFATIFISKIYSITLLASISSPRSAASIRSPLRGIQSSFTPRMAGARSETMPSAVVISRDRDTFGGPLTAGRTWESDTELQQRVEWEKGRIVYQPTRSSLDDLHEVETTEDGMTSTFGGVQHDRKLGVTLQRK